MVKSFFFFRQKFVFKELDENTNFLNVLNYFIRKYYCISYLSKQLCMYNSLIDMCAEA